MHDNMWLIPVFIIGPMLLGMAALFIALAIHSRKATQAGSPPGVVAYKTAPQRGSSGGPNSSQMSKSGALVLEAGVCKTRFEDVAGCDEAKDELQEIVQYLLEPGIFQEMGAKIPKGVLLVGPPGTGKTLLAKAVAGEAKATFMSISGPNFVEMFVGIGAARVRDLFEQARKNIPCIIFIDEIDAVGRKRSNAPNSNDERENTLNQLLVELDGFAEVTGIVVIAATNRLDILDPALIRPGRFDRHINVDLPDRSGREAIFAVHSRNKPLAANVSVKDLARLTPGFSGADIEAVCNEAATVAARRILKLAAAASENVPDKEILPADFDEGLLRVQVGVALGTRNKALSKEQLLNTAVHEVGHGWVSEALDGGFPVNRITILSRGGSLGHTAALPENEQQGMTREQILARISVLLAGRIAQEEILGVVDTGAQDDFRRVSALARQFVIQFGMSDLGPAAALAGDTAEGLSRLGPRLSDEVDSEIRQLIQSCTKVAKEIVRSNNVPMKALAQMLVEKETMLRDEWQFAKASVLAKLN
ncbi:MAG: cell division protease FtsH [Cyanobacteriota bacterium erpe_2018_sw_21hr_WHONDRS-SW48-000092_B_bin.40]|nr:cell division protease FtsH [Cyanobacteriota bacterium erpe_2018_sw_21hr_WHONDRS-SW48-000092_B_bin.40]